MYMLQRQNVYAAKTKLYVLKTNVYVIKNKVTSKMLPFDHLLGPLGVKMPLWGRLDAGLKMNVFPEGVPVQKNPPGAKDKGTATCIRCSISPSLGLPPPEYPAGGQEPPLQTSWSFPEFAIHIRSKKNQIVCVRVSLQNV